MRKLDYALLSAESMADPKKRALMLAQAAIEESRTLALIAQVLQEAEFAATSVTDPLEREQTVAAVNKAMERVGYNTRRKMFQLHRNTQA